MKKYCCGFGHSDIYKINEKDLIPILEKIITEYCITVFLAGGIGRFDGLFSSSVRTLKTKYPHINLILVKPYLTKELNRDKAFYETFYDEIIIPEISANAFYKSAITIRNKWMIDKSECVISGVYKNYGGAFNAIKYAERKNKKIIYLNKKMSF